MTLDRINKARALAEAHPGKASKIILALCAEVEKLRRLALRRGTHPTGVLEPWPYHPHLGIDFHEVPETVLVAWAKERTRAGLRFDIDLGRIAARDLAFYELIQKLNTKIEYRPDVQQQESALADAQIPAGRTQL